MRQAAKALWRRATLAATVLVPLAVLLVFWTQPPAVLPVLEFLTPQLVYRVDTDRPFVALSFDDGPHATYTPQVLDILDRYDAKATFFLIGEHAMARPDLVARIRTAGHEVGNHYFSRESTLGHSNRDFVEYLTRTEWVLGMSGEPKLFRPPGGVAWPGQLRQARERGYHCVLGSAYPVDPAHPPVSYIQWLVSKSLEPGAIVILHDGIADPTRTIAALPGVLDAAKEKGLRFVSIGTLMKKAAQPANAREG